MKITKQQLKQIIKEELADVISLADRRAAKEREERMKAAEAEEEILPLSISLLGDEADLDTVDRTGESRVPLSHTAMLKVITGETGIDNPMYFDLKELINLGITKKMAKRTRGGGGVRKRVEQGTPHEEIAFVEYGLPFQKDVDY